MIRKVTGQDAQAIADIYNVYVRDTAISFETEPVTASEMRRRIAEISADYPYWVYEDEGKVKGYCYAHPWKERAAYCKTLETTIYVASAAQGQGIGRELMTQLIAACRMMDVHVLVACITGDNLASIHFHRQLGFEQVSHFRQVGTKFGKWLDVVDLQLLL